MTLELAVQDDNVLLWADRGYYPAEHALTQTRELGASWVRFNVFSSYVARLGWGPWDAAIERCRGHGLSVQLTITGQPRWDQANPDGGVPYRDPDPEAFAAFAVRAVERYRDRVRRFSLWNEPNHPSFLASSAGDPAELYGRLYRAAYDAIRSIDRDATILFGELSGMQGSQSFLRRAVAKHPVAASGIAIHPYQYLTNPSRPAAGDNLQWGRIPDLLDLLADLARRRLLRTRDGRPLPVYVTEFGYFRSGEKRGIPEGRRAAYVAATIRQARAWGLRQYLYYHLVDAPPGAAWNSGIVAADGTPSATYDAIRSAFAT